jgi:biotin transport system substrate-specific component
MKTNVQKITFTALMAALLCILSPISIPLPSPMPAITLAIAAVYLSAYLTGPKCSSAAILIYILLGCIGLPVFSKGQAGLSVLAGPTGGYIIGYFFIAICTGFTVQKFEKKIYLHIIGMVIGTLICYTFGTVWLGISMHLSPKAAIAAGVAPFVVFDAIKLIACTAIGYPVRRQLARLLPGSISPAKQGTSRL